MKTFLSAILAGNCIALGGTAFLSVENKLLGAVLFTVGLYTICTFGLHLFTGKVCYAFQRDQRYILSLPVIWLGNLCGTWLTAQLELFTRIAPTLVEKATPIANTKLSDNLLSTFLLAIFCNIMIYIAVEGFAKSPHDLGKYLALFFGVVVFILCGYEHCVANMYYFSIAGVWSERTLLCLMVTTLGNAAGGVIYPVLRGLMEKSADSLA